MTQSSNQNNETEYMFVRSRIMLGDADGWIKEHGIITACEWRQHVACFELYREKTRNHYVERDNDMHGCYSVDLECFTTIPCTSEEKATLEKFMGTSSIRLPAEYVEDYVTEEEWEHILATVS